MLGRCHRKIDHKQLILKKKRELVIRRKTTRDERPWHVRERIMHNIAAFTYPGRDAKVTNDFFVANVLREFLLLQEAASFFCDVCRFYNDSAERRSLLIRAVPHESQHNWPCTPGQAAEQVCPAYAGRNLENRGLLYMVQTWLWQKTTSTPVSVWDGLRSAYRPMLNLALRFPNQPYTDDEIGFILRGMLLLRDVTKAEKHGHHPGAGMETWLRLHEFPYYTRVRGAGVMASRARIPGIGLPTYYVKPALLSSSVAALYQYPPMGSRDLSPRARPRGKAHDFIQGMSGSTLDYCNWLRYVVANIKRSHLDDTDKVMRLFQVNYAAWHTVCPDGFAHSQHESLTPLCAMFYEPGRGMASLAVEIMTPIRSQADLLDMAEHGYLVIGESGDASDLLRVD